MPNKVQDTIKFPLSAEEVVVNDTVKIEANIVAMITSEMDDDAFKDATRKVMRDFIKADWQFSNMVRGAHASGMEQVSMTATVRVAEKENRALDRRREEAARGLDWLNIVNARTDTTPSNAQIEETHRKLRLAILAKARDELQAINDATGEDYRLGIVDFIPNFESVTANTRHHALSASATSYDAGFDTPAKGGAIGNAVKLVMSATVELRISR